MEGYFKMSLTLEGSEGITTTITAPQQTCPNADRNIRVCSTSSDISDIRLWAYYGGAQAGIAIEIDFTGIENLLRKVRYEHELKKYYVTNGNQPDLESILTRKFYHWEHEKEYRIFSKEKFFSVKNRIRRVIMGRSCPRSNEEILRRLLPANCTLARVGLDPGNFLLSPYDL